MDILEFKDTGITNTVLVYINSTKSYLESAKGVIAGITIPSDFSQGAAIRNSLFKISDIIGKISSVDVNIQTSVSNFLKAEANNEALVNGFLLSIPKTGNNIEKNLSNTNRKKSITGPNIYNTKIGGIIGGFQETLSLLSNNRNNLFKSTGADYLLGRLTNPLAIGNKQVNLHLNNNTYGTFIKEGSLDKDGYEQIYVSSLGYMYNDYKQNSPALKGYEYRDDGTTIGGNGCGLCAIADCLSGLGVDKTPIDLANELDWVTDAPHTTAYLQSIGVDGKLIAEPIDAEGVKDLINDEKIVVLHFNNDKFSYEVSPEDDDSWHYVAIVDVNDKDEFLILNPYIDIDNPVFEEKLPSGWYPTSVVTYDNNCDRIEINLQLKE